MPEYLSPGVYVEEFEIGAQPIAGVSTSTAGMVGVTEMGQVDGLPQLVTSFGEFERKYGGFLDKEYSKARYLPYAVQGFFQNGGQRLYIKRVVGENAKTSKLDIKDGIVTWLAADVSDTDRTKATVVCMRGISYGTQLTFQQTDGGTVKSDQATVASYNGNTVTLNKALSFSYKKFVTQVTVKTPAINSIAVTAKNPGAWGDKISIIVEPVGRAVSALKKKNVTTTMDTLTNATLQFSANGPGVGATNVVLKDVSNIQPNDAVRFDNNVNSETRTITAVDATAKKISWTDGLTNNYASGSITLCTALRAVSLSFAGNGPQPGASQIQLNDVTLVKANDTVTLIDGNGNSEQAVILSVTTGTKTITLKNPISGDYSGAGSSIIPSSYIYTCNVNSLNGFSVNDRIVLRGANCSNFATIKSISGKVVGFTIDDLEGLNGNYLVGEIIEMRTAIRANDVQTRVSSINNLYIGAIVEFDNGTNKEYFVITDIDKLQSTISWDPSKPAANAYLDGATILVWEFKLTASFQPAVGVPLQEVFPNLTMDVNTSGYFKDIINKQSTIITVDDYTPTTAAPANFPCTADYSGCYLAGGDEGAMPPSPATYKGTDDGPGKRTGILSFLDIDDISLIAVPGISWDDDDASNPEKWHDLQGALIEHCEIQTKTRFAVIDPPQGTSFENIQKLRGFFDTSYSAMYYPWLQIIDPLTDSVLFIPPSGHLMGIFARSDVNRGVHKAPANELVQGIVGLEVQINKGEQDIINPKGINAIRVFSGAGTKVWGARTMSSNTQWQYVNVRRLFIYLEASIDKGTQWVVFEPNDVPLWARVRQTIDQFLTDVWRSGALAGNTAEEAFFVKCDRSTMSQGDIDNGRLICVIGVAPVKPAEFVVFRIAQWTAGAKK